jgi:elongator complex protein 6
MRWQGLDLQRLSEQGRFAFIDGLSELFAISPAPSSSQAQQSGATPLRPSTTLPVRAASATGPVPARGPAASTIISVSKAPAASTQSTPAAQTQLHFTGRGVSALDSLEKDVLGVIANLQTKNNSNNNGRLADSEENNDVVLIIDQPDLLLAATGPAQGIGATEMSEWLMGLQQVTVTILEIPGQNAQGYTLGRTLHNPHSIC